MCWWTFCCCKICCYKMNSCEICCSVLRQSLVHQLTCCYLSSPLRSHHLGGLLWCLSHVSGFLALVSVHAVAFVVGGEPISMLAPAVVTVAVFALHASVTILLPKSMAQCLQTLGPTVDLPLFTLAVMTLTVGALHNTGGPSTMVTIAYCSFDYWMILNFMCFHSYPDIWMNIIHRYFYCFLDSWIAVVWRRISSQCVDCLGSPQHTRD